MDFEPLRTASLLMQLLFARRNLQLWQPMQLVCAQPTVQPAMLVVLEAAKLTMAAEQKQTQYRWLQILKSLPQSITQSLPQYLPRLFPMQPKELVCL